MLLLGFAAGDAVSSKQIEEVMILGCVAFFLLFFQDQIVNDGTALLRSHCHFSLFGVNNLSDVLVELDFLSFKLCLDAIFIMLSFIIEVH